MDPLLLGEHRHSLDTASGCDTGGLRPTIPGEGAQVAAHVVHHWRVEQHL